MAGTHGLRKFARYVGKYPELNKTPNNGMLLRRYQRRQIIYSGLYKRINQQRICADDAKRSVSLAELSASNRDRQERMVNIQTHDGLVI